MAAPPTKAVGATLPDRWAWDLPTVYLYGTTVDEKAKVAPEGPLRASPVATGKSNGKRSPWLASMRYNLWDNNQMAFLNKPFHIAQHRDMYRHEFP